MRGVRVAGLVRDHVIVMHTRPKLITLLGSESFGRGPVRATTSFVLRCRQVFQLTVRDLYEKRSGQGCQTMLVEAYY